MDFGTLIWLLILLVPVLARLFDKNKRQQPADEASAAREMTWQDALAQLQAAARGEHVAPPVAPEPRPQARTLAAPTALEKKVGPSAPRSVPERMYDDEFALPQRKAPAPLAPKAPRRNVQAPLIERLRDVDRAREAFLLSEVLGPPRSQQPLQRRP